LLICIFSLSKLHFC